MLKKLLLGLFSLIVLLCIYVALKPADYRISRSITINSSAERLWPYLVSAKKADEWMPWKDTDPEVRMTYSGPNEGVGSTSSWESRGRMGVGKAEVIEAVAQKMIRTQITYSKPMQFTQTSEFVVEPISTTELSLRWSVEGRTTFISRLMCTLTAMDMDKYVGGQFEKGLNRLKGLLEDKR